MFIENDYLQLIDISALPVAFQPKFTSKQRELKKLQTLNNTSKDRRSFLIKTASSAQKSNYIITRHRKSRTICIFANNLHSYTLRNIHRANVRGWRSRVDFRVHLVHRQFRGGFGKLDRLVDLLSHFLVNFLQFLGCRPLLF